jgi:histidinol-phosphate aminotransferase
MRISRRKALRKMAAGAATVAIPSLTRVSLGGVRGSARPSENATNVAGPIRLSRNENPYGPSARMTAAMREAAGTVANRYPDTEAEALRLKIAAFHQVTPEQVVLGCGSRELMRTAVDAFSGRGRKLVLARPTFDLIARFAENAGAEVIAVPLAKDYAHDLEAMLARVDASAGLVYICNPNNPTGTLTRRQDIEAFVRSLPPATRVFIDEAYHHYVTPSSDYASFIDRPMDGNGVIVARTFSQVYGLAGLRIGYAVAAPATARVLESYRLPDEVNIVAAKAAITALGDSEHVVESVKRNADNRQEFFNQANARMVRAIDSHANFVMLNTGRPAAEVIEHFRKNNIVLPPPIPSFDEHIRVSLGTVEDMCEFWRVWDLQPAVQDMVH